LPPLPPPPAHHVGLEELPCTQRRPPQVSLAARSVSPLSSSSSSFLIIASPRSPPTTLPPTVLRASPEVPNSAVLPLVKLTAPEDLANFALGCDADLGPSPFPPLSSLLLLAPSPADPEHPPDRRPQHRPPRPRPHSARPLLRHPLERAQPRAPQAGRRRARWVRRLPLQAAHVPVWHPDVGHEPPRLPPPQGQELGRRHAVLCQHPDRGPWCVLLPSLSRSFVRPVERPADVALSPSLPFPSPSPSRSSTVAPALPLSLPRPPATAPPQSAPTSSSTASGSRSPHRTTPHTPGPTSSSPCPTSRSPTRAT